MMNTIKFDCNGNNSPAYGCNKPGDNSGEYVRADVARKLYDALKAFEYNSAVEVNLPEEYRRLKAALTTADGKSYEH